MKHLLERLRCGHWADCALTEVSATYPGGVPLVGFLQHRDVLIAIICANWLVNCVNKAIRRLKAAGRGDGNTGVLALGRAVRGPCRKCGMGRFVTEVFWLKGG